jgi:hypothetical protein
MHDSSSLSIPIATLAIEIRSFAGIVAYLFVADLNTITKSALQHLQAFGLGWELCPSDSGVQRKKRSCTEV